MLVNVVVVVVDVVEVVVVVDDVAVVRIYIGLQILRFLLFKLHIHHPIELFC